MCELPRSGRVIVLVLVVESVSSPVVPEVGVVSCGFGHPDGNESSMFIMGALRRSCRIDGEMNY